MNKCYYCNNSPNGCAECRRKAGEVFASYLADRDEVQVQDGKVQQELAPIPPVVAQPDDNFNSGLVTSDWESQKLYIKCVQHEVKLRDQTIQLELVREPSHRFPSVYSRTSFTFLSDNSQWPRVMAWSMPHLDALHLLCAADPALLASYIVGYWGRRQVAKDAQDALNRPCVHRAPASTLRIGGGGSFEFEFEPEPTLVRGVDLGLTEPKMVGWATSYFEGSWDLVEDEDGAPLPAGGTHSWDSLHMAKSIDVANHFSANALRDIARRVGEYWQKRSLEMLVGTFKESLEE